MSSNAEHWDSITVEQLRAIRGRKWSHYPDALGAFIAETDFGTAPAVTEALRQVVDTSYYGYLTPDLTQRLREATASWLADRYGWQVDPLSVRRLPDVLSGLEVTLEYFTKRTDSAIILPTPAYMPFLSVPKPAWRRETITVPLAEDGGRWSLDLDAIDRAFAAGGEVLVLSNPHNPTGRVYTRDELVALSEVVERHGGRVFSDEIHAPLVYQPNRHVPYATVNETAASHTITATSASKAWNLAGLKSAQLILSNEADAQHWRKVGYWPEDGASTIGVIANTAAYEHGRQWLDDEVTYLDRNRHLLTDLLTRHLPQARYYEPEGTYLAWIDLRAYDLPTPLIDFFLHEAGVAITDGRATGREGAGFIRVNFATPTPILRQIVAQLGDAVSRHLA